MRLNLKIISLITLLCFLTTNAVWSLPVSEILPTSSTNFLQVQVPSELASIEEMYEAPASIDSKLILHIQNVHGNYEAQNQIKKLLGYLDKSYGFKLLFVEGASEKLDPKYLELFPDKENNKRLAESLAQSGALTGPELFILEHPKNVEALGIENPELYRSDYETFKKVYNQKENSDLVLKNIEERLDRLSSRFLSSDARRLVSEWKKFEAGHRDFLPFVERLAKDANKFSGIDLTSLFAQAEWPQATRLLVLQQMEKELDRSKAEREKTKLVQFLKSIQIPDQTIEEIDHLGERRITMSKTSAGSDEKESLPRYLLERLAREAAGKGFHFHDYPAFSLYAGYLILQSELDSRALFNEIEILFDKILTALTPAEREKNLLELFRDHDLLTKLLHLELSRKEWDRAAYRKDWLLPTSLTRRIELIEEQAGGPASNPETKIQDLTKSLQETFEAGILFYDLARKRESGFFEKLKEEMRSRGEDKAVIITGGFHADGIADIFREEGINYGVLMPRITQKIDNVSYIANMLEKQPTRFDLATIEAVNTLQRPELRGQMGLDPTVSTRTLVDHYLDAAQFGTSAELRTSIDRFNQMSVFFNLGARMELRREAKALEIIFKNGESYTVPLQKLSNGSVGFTNTAKQRQELRSFDEAQIRSKFAAIDTQLGAYFDVTDPGENFVRNPENGELRQTPIDALLKLIRHYQLEYVSGLKVLEIGTGTGVAAYAFAEIPNSHVTSIEVQPDRLQFANGARNYLEEHGISYSNVEFKPGNFLAYNTDNFDVIYFYYTHPEDPAARRSFAKSVIEKLNQELKPGQRAIFLNFGHIGTPEAEEMENLNSGKNGPARISISRGKITEGIVATEFKVKDTEQRPEMRTASAISRRNFLGLGAGLAAALMLPEIPSINAQSQPPQNRIAYNALPASSRRLIAENMSRLIQIARTKNLTALSNAFKGWENKLYVVQGSDREGDLHGGGEASIQGVYLDEGMLNWVLNSPNDPAASYIFIRTLLHEFVHHEHAKSGSAKNRTREQEENITRLETAFFFGDSIYTSYNGVLGPSGTVRPAPNQKFFNDKNELIAYEDTKNVVFSVFLVKDASGKVQFFKSPDGIEMPAIYLNAYPDQLPERLINQAKIKELEAVLKSGTQNQTDTEKIQKEITRLRGLIANLLPRLLTPEVQAQGNKITALFPETGRYVIQSTPNLRWWTNVTNEILIVEPGQRTFTLPNQNQMNLYRVAYLGRSELRPNSFMGLVAKYASLLLLSLGFNEISFSQAQAADRGPVIEAISRENNQTLLTISFNEPGGYAIESSSDLKNWIVTQKTILPEPWRGRSVVLPVATSEIPTQNFYRVKKLYPWMEATDIVGLGGLTDRMPFSEFLNQIRQNLSWIDTGGLMEAIAFSKERLPLVQSVSKELLDNGILKPNPNGNWFPTLFVPGLRKGTATAIPNLGLTIVSSEDYESAGIEERRQNLLLGIGHEQTHNQDYQANPNIAPLETENNAYFVTWKVAKLANLSENAISAQKMVSDAFQALINKQTSESFVTALFDLTPDKFNQIYYEDISLTGFDAEPRIQIRLWTTIRFENRDFRVSKKVEFSPKDGALEDITNRPELRSSIPLFSRKDSLEDIIPREAEKSQRLIKAFTDMAASAIAIKPSARNNFSTDYSYKTEITDDPSTGHKKIKVSYLFSSGGSEPAVVGESNMTLVGLDTPEPKIVSYGTNIEDPQHQGRGLKSSLNSDLREKLAGLKILFETAIDNNLTLLRIHRLLAAKIEGQTELVEIRERMLRLDETYTGIDANKALAGGTFLSAEDQISVLRDIKALYDLGIKLTSDELGEMKPVGELGKELGPYQEIQPVIINETTDPQVVINHFIWIGETQKRAELRLDLFQLLSQQPVTQPFFTFSWTKDEVLELHKRLFGANGFKVKGEGAPFKEHLRTLLKPAVENAVDTLFENLPADKRETFTHYLARAWVHSVENALDVILQKWDTQTTSTDKAEITFGVVWEGNDVRLYTANNGVSKNLAETTDQKIRAQQNGQKRFGGANRGTGVAYEDMRQIDPNLIPFIADRLEFLHDVEGTVEFFMFNRDDLEANWGKLRAELRSQNWGDLWSSELVGLALELDLMKHQPMPGFQSSYNFKWQGADLAEVEDNLRKAVRQKAAKKTGADELLEFIHMIGDPQDQTFTELQELSRTTDQNPILVRLIRDIVETAMASPAIEEWDKEDILKNAFSAQFALGLSIITEDTEDVDNPTPWSRELQAWLNSIALRDFGQPIKDLMVSKAETNAMQLLIRIKTEGTKYEVKDFEAGTTLEDFLKSKLDDSNPDWTKIDIVIGNRRVFLANAKTLETPLRAGAQVYVLKRSELRQISAIQNIPGTPSLGETHLNSSAIEAALEADGRFDYLVATMTSRGVLEISSSMENIEAFAKTAVAANQNPITDILEEASQALLNTITPPESKSLEPGKSIVLLLPKQREKDGGISPKTMLEQFLRVVQAYNVETAHIAGHIPQRIPGEVMSRVAPVTLSGLTRLTAASGQATYPTVLGVDAAALSADLPADLIPVEMTNVESLATEEAKAYAALLQSVIAAHIARITAGRKTIMNSTELKSELLKAIQLDEKFQDMVEVGSANNHLSVSISGVVTQAYLTHLASEKAKQAA